MQKKMDRAKIAENKFLEKYTCSQAIISTYSDRFNIDRKTALDLSAGFAGGMRIGKTCGVVTGSIMILGLAFSGKNSEKPEDRKEVYEATCQFINKFVETYKSIECKDLLTVDLGTTEGREEATKKNLFYTVCPKYIRTAAEILESLVNI